MTVSISGFDIPYLRDLRPQYESEVAAELDSYGELTNPHATQ